MLVPKKPNERRSVDFMSDPLADGQLVDTSISGARMARFLT